MLKESNRVKNFFFSAVRNLNFLIWIIGILLCQPTEYIFGGPKRKSMGREGKFMFIEHMLSLRYISFIYHFIQPSCEGGILVSILWMENLRLTAGLNNLLSVTQLLSHLFQSPCFSMSCGICT